MIHNNRRSVTYQIISVLDVKEFSTDPYEVRSDQCGAAGTPRLAVDINACSAPSVLQGELHSPVEVLQGGDSSQVHGAQPQLLYACGSPLLLRNITRFKPLFLISETLFNLKPSLICHH